MNSRVGGCRLGELAQNRRDKASKIQIHIPQAVHTSCDHTHRPTSRSKDILDEKDRIMKRNKDRIIPGHNIGGKIWYDFEYIHAKHARRRPCLVALVGKVSPSVGAEFGRRQPS